MKDLLKKIREFSGLSQAEMAAELGVTFATINRWENGHVIPNKMAQMNVYEFCQSHSVPLYDWIIKKILTTAEKIQLEDGRMILYHGSKEGIKGKIKPISRDKCDFGKGFYMGTEPGQPLTLICDFEKSKFYIVSVKLNGLAKIEIPADIDWAMLVAYHRGRMERIKDTPLYLKYSTYSNKKDLMIGSIANDRMFFVIDNFFQELITDQALVGSLSALQLGRQYVAITQKACDAVRIENEVELSYLERKCLKVKGIENRKKGIDTANDICKSFRRKGKFFDEILEDALKGGK